MKNKYIDLHLHLDGAVTVGIARALAELQGIELPADDGQLERLLTVPEDCSDLNEFLKCFGLPLSLMQTHEGLCEAVRLVGDSMAEQGIIYAEIRFAPQLHTDKGLTQEAAVRAALEGLGRTKLKANLILCAMRGDSNEDKNEETLRLAQKYLVKDGGVVALDLAGAEGLFPTEKYREFFAKAQACGVPFTIHAGEADGAQSIRAALEFGAARLGHGVRITEDEELIELVKERGVALEMCPTSNRQTHAVEDMSAYPLISLLERGVPVTLNTDDPGIEGIDIAHEYRYMESLLGLDEVQERAILKNAVKAAFTTDEVKAQLMHELGNENMGEA